MRYSVFAAIICLPITIFAVLAHAEESEPLSLEFDGRLKPAIRSRMPGIDAWEYYITAPDDIGESVRDEKEVKRHITLAPGGDKSACRLKSKRNYVGLGRLIDPTYSDAQRLAWKWSVAKHPHNGTLGGTPNDAALTIHICFREPKADVEKPDPQNLKHYEYTVLAYTWTSKTKASHQMIRGQTPWRGMPRGDIYYQSIRDGVIEDELSEEIDLKEEYMKVYSKAAPPLWGIVVMCDSNDVESEVGEMTTDSVIREIKLYK